MNVKKQDAIVDMLRSKDAQVIKSLLDAMCVTASRDIDVFRHAQQKYNETHSEGYNYGTNEPFLKERIKKSEDMLKLLMLLKTNIYILTKSPL